MEKKKAWHEMNRQDKEWVEALTKFWRKYLSLEGCC